MGTVLEMHAMCIDDPNNDQDGDTICAGVDGDNCPEVPNFEPMTMVMA